MLCELSYLNGANVAMKYTEDFYAGKPALTQHQYGQGEVYYIATQFEQAFYDDFYAELLKRAGLASVLTVALPSGVLVSARAGADQQFVFLQNATPEAQHLPALGEEWTFLTGSLTDVVSVHVPFTLAPYELQVIQRSIII